MNVAEHFAEGGSLSQAIDGFTSRIQQQKMAESIAGTIDDGGMLVIEAGTGIGKTFAYLVPAIVSGKRVIIATGTRNLQDQLFHNDLPTVRSGLGIPVTVALLKGRANYLCMHRLEASRKSDDYHSSHYQHELSIISDWAGRTLTGDVSEIDDVEEDSMIWPLATSTIENCLGSDCEHYGNCYVFKARREAQTADIIIINHHLLLADMALKEQGFGDILPGVDVFIIDEAHQLPEISSKFFSITVTSRQLYNLVEDTRAEHIRQGRAQSKFLNLLDKLEKSIADLRLSMGQAEQRLSWNEASKPGSFTAALNAIRENLMNLRDCLHDVSDDSKELDNCYKRSLDLFEKTNDMIMPSDESVASEVHPGHIRWVDTSRRGFGLHSTPLDIAEVFQASMQEMDASWIFTSATLTVDGSFRHFNRTLGLEDPVTQVLDHPFNYKKNTLSYMPPGMPEPSDPSYTREMCSKALPVIMAAGGRTFMLFTSHRALKVAAQFMKDHIKDYPILIQGGAPRKRLLEDFKVYGNAVLMGAASFWEGVDVRGDALSCVIIDRLPFASPDDPVMQARLDAMKKRGENPFLDYQLPNAVVSLRQGIGRLIRDADDRGVLMLCDPRLKSKSYGKIFLKSLPEMPMAGNEEEVVKFFAQPS